MDGIPWELDEMPRQMAHRPKDHKFSSAPAPKSQNRRRPPSAPTSPTPGSSFGLDTISERPRKKSAMKPPRTPTQPSSGYDQGIGVIGDRIAGNGTGNMGEFELPPKSFGAGRGGPPLNLAQVDTDAANAYLSGGVGRNRLAIQSTDGIVAAASTLPATTGPVVTKPPKTPTMSRLWNWRK